MGRVTWGQTQSLIGNIVIFTLITRAKLIVETVHMPRKTND